MIKQLCPKHSQELTRKAATKILRMARKCQDCMRVLTRTKPPRLCADHNALYDVWEKKQLNKIKCEDCR